MIPDFGWSEMLMIGIVLIVVVGPKDLPKLLRGFGKGVKSMRKMSDDFRKQFSQALDEAELSEVREFARDAKALDPRNSIKDALAPLGAMGRDLNNEVKKAAKGIESSGSETSGDDEIEAPAVNPPKPWTPTPAEKALSDSGSKARAAQSAKKGAVKPAAGDAGGEVTDAAPVARKAAPRKGGATSKATGSKTTGSKSGSTAKAATKSAATGTKAAPTAAARKAAKAADASDAAAVEKPAATKRKTAPAKTSAAKTATAKTSAAKSTAAKKSATKAAPKKSAGNATKSESSDT